MGPKCNHKVLIRGSQRRFDGRAEDKGDVTTEARCFAAGLKMLAEGAKSQGMQGTELQKLEKDKALLKPPKGVWPC